jgi:hypothetical protein
MHQSACQANLDPDRLSFTHAVEVLDTACSAFALVACEELPRLQARLLPVPSQAAGTARLYPQTAELSGHSMSHPEFLWNLSSIFLMPTPEVSPHWEGKRSQELGERRSTDDCSPSVIDRAVRWLLGTVFRFGGT